jgi:hypothetical protein
MLTEGPVVLVRYMATFYKILEVYLYDKYNVLFKPPTPALVLVLADTLEFARIVGDI